jgi:arsenate reductase
MTTILYVCVHNAGRSQMAEALTNKLAADRGLDIHAISAGTQPTERINAIAARVMSEIGIAIRDQRPKLLTQVMAENAERIITMGCGVEAGACPARIHITEDWGLDDPAGQPIEKVRSIRDQIQARVEALLEKLEQEQ